MLAQVYVRPKSRLGPKYKKKKKERERERCSSIISVVLFYHSKFCNKFHDFFVFSELGDMAVRLMNGGSPIFRCCAVSPPLTALRCCLRSHRHAQFHSSAVFSVPRRLRRCRASFGYERVAVRRYSAQNLVDLVMEELESFRKRRGGVARAANKYAVNSDFPFLCFLLLRHDFCFVLYVSVEFAFGIPMN